MPVRYILFLAGFALLADTSIPSLEPDEREHVLRIQISAHRALEHVQLAQIQQKQARLDEIDAQRELDKLNAELDRMNADLSKKYDPEGKFRLTPDLAFAPKESQ